jgi:hypothetical protein
MANEENLKPFKKGHDNRRNIAGAPKKLPALDVIMAEVFDDDKMAKIIESLEKQALKGNVRAAEVLLDRAYGKAKQSMDITTNGESINIPPKEWANDKP